MFGFAVREAGFPKACQMVQSEHMSLRLNVPLSGGREYDIHVGDGTLVTDAGTVLAQVARSKRAIVITQPKIAALWGAKLVSSLFVAGFDSPAIVTFPHGERYKNLKVVTQLCDSLYDLSPAIDRKTLIIALGGGVVGDVAGFVASLYLRGLDYVQVPTTLLAMVDSSVGGKTGVDFREGKNLIGAFYQPRSVLIDVETLSTLPARERRAGIAEVIKYGVIREPSILSLLSGREMTYRDTAVLSDLIQRSCIIKADVVSRDEYETTGLRAILNFGHTVGHALESATNYRRYKHGEAVAIGMMAAAAIGEAHGVTPPEVRTAIEKALIAQKLPTGFPPEMDVETILPLMARDKKAEGGKARFVLATSIGSTKVFSDVEESAIREGIRRVTRH